ncbi:MAG: hypothetical protein LBV67_01360 [Streptococcaceae bacterium]|nr:hypothetical protein [Streptococcaceae bacterium]
MITVNLAQKQQDAIALLEAQEGEFTYKFLSKAGIRLKFQVTGDPEAAAANAKKIIKAQPWGAALYFNAVAG